MVIGVVVCQVATVEVPWVVGGYDAGVLLERYPLYNRIRLLTHTVILPNTDIRLHHPPTFPLQPLILRHHLHQLIRNLRHFLPQNLILPFDPVQLQVPVLYTTLVILVTGQSVQLLDVQTLLAEGFLQGLDFGLKALVDE